MGQLDAAVMPEHYPSIAVAQGFKVLFSSRDVWPDMHGSTLVVSEKLLESSPEIVRSLVKVNREATRWIHAHPKEAAVIVANVLQADGGMGKLSPVFPAKEASLAGKLTISPDVTLASITRGLDITTKIDPQQVQKTIDFMYSQGLLRNRFEAQKILKLDWPKP
jgi:NitT/TauT family transport system substrate-binding protein